MFRIGDLEFEKPLMLAPMEEVTDISYRKFCRRMGADIVFTEFVNSDGLIRGNSKGIKNGFTKMEFLEEERPIAIQIYGNDTENMVNSAVLAEEQNPNFIDINAGCWVKKVSKRGAGAGLLKDPVFMQGMIEQLVKAVNLPVTVKTRIGWDDENLNILEVAQRLEDVGVQALTVHCRTRCQGHSGDARWEWVARIKEKVKIPVILNGGIMSVDDAVRAFKTPCDGIMVARGAIGTPWIFREIKEYMEYGSVINPVTLAERVEMCLAHLRSFMELKGDLVGIRAFRKFYSGYLKGFPEIANLRKELMQHMTYQEVSNSIYDYLESAQKRGQFVEVNRKISSSKQVLNSE